MTRPVLNRPEVPLSRRQLLALASAVSLTGCGGGGTGSGDLTMARPLGVATGGTGSRPTAFLSAAITATSPLGVGGISLNIQGAALSDGDGQPLRMADLSLGKTARVLAGAIVASLTLGWQPLPGDPLWHGSLWIAAISLLAAIGLGLCCGWADHADFLGLKQAWTGNAEMPGPLIVAGPYRFVRHPLMLGLLVAIWAQPIMPPELLLMNVGLTLYVLLAIQWEERDLLREYGAEYEKYRSEVPMLIPWKMW